MKKFLFGAALVILAGCTLMKPEPALADTGLVMVCKDSTKAGVLLNASSTTRCPTLAWVRPATNSLVAGCTSTNCGSWTDPNAKWTLWSALPSTARALMCTADITPNVSFAAGLTANDPCPAANKPSPWPLKTAIQTAATPAGFTAKLRWLPPTQNEDGSTLTNLKGFYVFKSVGTDLVAGVEQLPEGARLQEIADPAATTIELPVNPDQRTYFAMTAYACNETPCVTKIESKLSAVVDTLKASPVPPTVTMSCSPASGIRRASVTCTWSSANATACSASNGWAGSKPVSGSETIQITESAMFNLSCTGAGGTTSTSQPVIINSAPVTVSGFTVE